MPKAFETPRGESVDVNFYDRDNGDRVCDVEVVDQKGEVVAYHPNLSHTGLTVLAAAKRWIPC